MAKILVADGMVESEEPSIVKTKTSVFTPNTPLPYPVTADLSKAEKVSTHVFIDGKAVILEDSEIPQTKGSEQGNPNGGNTSGTNGAKSFPKDVKDRGVYINGKKVVTTEDTWGMDGNDCDSCNTTGTVFMGSHVTIGEWTPPDIYDERFLFKDPNGKPLSGMLYTAKLSSGRLTYGITNSEGYTRLFRTDGPQYIEIYFGQLKPLQKGDAPAAQDGQQPVPQNAPKPVIRAQTNTTPDSVLTVTVRGFAPKSLNISDEGLAFIAGYEGSRIGKDGLHHLYNDTGHNATIGYGHLVHKGPITDADHNEEYGKGITETEARRLLRKGAGDAESQIHKSLRVPVTQQEFDALVSLIFNSGTDARHDTMRALNEGRPEDIPEIFRKHNHDNHRVVQPGLVTRREREIQIFNGGTYDSRH